MQGYLKQSCTTHADYAFACTAAVVNIVRGEKHTSVKDLQARFWVGAWTIDILNMLATCLAEEITCSERVELLLTSSSFDIDADNAVLDFDSRESFDQEALRINTMLQRYTSRRTPAVRVVRKVVSLDSIVEYLRRSDQSFNVAYIALVDTSLLSCRRHGCRRHTQADMAYSSSYILLLGACSQDHLWYYDPTASCDICCTLSSSFEAARTQSGTDSDLLRVTWRPQVDGHPSETPIQLFDGE